MISIKKYMEMNPEKPNQEKAAPPPLPDEPRSNTLPPEDLASVIMASYRSALLAVGKSGARAFPAVGLELQQSLAKLEHHLSGDLTSALVKETEAEIEQQLQCWEDRSAEYLKAKAADVKELLILIARTAESVGERDQRYASHFQDLTSQLQTIANLDDLGQVRVSLVKRATELTVYVNRMAEESKKSVAQLQAEVSTYETKLKAAEQIALQDELTSLANRRNIEERIGGRIERRQTFCVVLLDLNHFKQVNDTYGHLAGDNLLKQFAQELRSSLSSTGLAGRWSGDEFIVVLDCDLAAAEAQIERLRKWVFGEYTIRPGTGKPVKVNVDASLGVVQWQADQTIQQVIELADAAMYADKKKAKKQHA